MALARIDAWWDRLWDRVRGESEVLRGTDPPDAEDVSPTIAETDEAPQISEVRLLAPSNAAAHHTAPYELVTRTDTTLVVRRAAAFDLEVVLNHEVDLRRRQRLVLAFETGPRPNPLHGTRVVLPVGVKGDFDRPVADEWDTRVTHVEGNVVTVGVQVEAQAPVGLWRVSATVSPRSDGPPSPTAPKPPTHSPNLDHLSIYILFNPWSKEDQVYMADEKLREEFVLNDVGKIWHNPRHGRHWVYGQFDDAVLPAVALLLERSGLSPEDRASPVLVARAVSRIVNSNDDRGVVVGKWDRDYEEGTTRPTEWTGSIKILEEYVRRGRPVRYGQCWVFAGVVVTVCRALGLPCRPVTNLNSAHDTNSSLTIDEYFDEDGEDYEFTPGADTPAGYRDSIWNFHVWNDVWMARPDLPGGYGGWQAIDATPQETSGGLYQCGPASLEAVRRGDVSLPYDVAFVLAEVNADLIRWKKDPNEKTGFKPIASYKTHVGRQLLTKAVGTVHATTADDDDRDDVTTEYKAPEGTDTERVTLYGAARRIRSARHAFRFPSVAETDVEFELLDVGSVSAGQDYAVAVSMRNTGSSTRTVSLSLSSSSEYYTGVKAHLIKRADGTWILAPGNEERLRLVVRSGDYTPRLVEHGHVKVLAMASVKETTQTWVQDLRFQVIKPDLLVQAPPTAAQGAPIEVRVSFTNPLQEALTQAAIVVDGPGLTRPKRIPVPDVGAGEEFSHNLRLWGRKVGESRPLVVTFSSRQLTDLMGSTTVTITPA